MPEPVRIMMNSTIHQTKLMKPKTSPRKGMKESTSSVMWPKALPV